MTVILRYYFYHTAILEPAKYDGRKKTTHEGSTKYLNDAAGIPTQGTSKGGRERWSNKLRGFSAKEGGTGFHEQHHGNNIPTLPARNKRSVCGRFQREDLKGRTSPPSLLR